MSSVAIVRGDAAAHVERDVAPHQGRKVRGFNAGVLDIGKHLEALLDKVLLATCKIMLC